MGEGTKKTHFLISSENYQKKQVSDTVKLPLKGHSYSVLQKIVAG